VSVVGVFDRVLRQMSEQYFTSSRFFAHRFRQVIERPQMASGTLDSPPVCPSADPTPDAGVEGRSSTQQQTADQALLVGYGRAAASSGAGCIRAPNAEKRDPGRGPGSEGLDR
jgi:hypothetical protein